MSVWIGVAGLVGATMVGVGIAYRSHVTAYLRGWVGRHIVADDPWQQSSPEQAEDQAMALANSTPATPQCAPTSSPHAPCGRDIPADPSKSICVGRWPDDDRTQV